MPKFRADLMVLSSDIAVQCENIGGSAVGIARDMLSDCDKAELTMCYEDLHFPSVQLDRDTVSELQNRNFSGENDILYKDETDYISSSIIYPNPSNSGLISIETQFSTGDFEVQELNGRVLYKNNITFGLNTFNIQLNKGVYFVVIRDEIGKIDTKKLIIQ